MEAATEAPKLEMWAVVELMGHVRLAGRVTEENRFGTVMGRIDIPSEGEKFVTQYFSGSSIYRVTPVEEAAARAMARHHQPKPVHSWELPQLSGATQVESMHESDHDNSSYEDSEFESEIDDEEPERPW